MINLDSILSLKHSPIYNYILPGVNSWLISSPGDKGVVRLFENTRLQHESVTPHSHRFDFYSYVLSGTVTNELRFQNKDGDEYRCSTLQYQGKPGSYEKISYMDDRWVKRQYVYNTGQGYHMTTSQFHSIVFSKDALVLIFEGPAVKDYSNILEPIINNKVIPTFKVEPWMFKP